MSERQRIGQLRLNAESNHKTANNQAQQISNPETLNQLAFLKPETLSPAGVLQMQRMLGNRAVRQLMQSWNPKVPGQNQSASIRQADSQGGENAVIQRASLTIGSTIYTTQSEVDDIVKTVEDYQEDRDLYLSQVFFQQDRVFKTQEELFAEIKKQRPSFMLTEKYWKNLAVQDEIPDTSPSKKGKKKAPANAYQQSQVEGFWKSYIGSKGKARDVSTIIKETGKKLLDEVENAGKTTDEQLRLYRGMKKDEGFAIIRWFYGQRSETEKRMKGGTLDEKDLQDTSPTNRVGIMPIKHHLGGFEQAQNYGKGVDEVVMEFTLKKGAHNIMFKPEYMAVAPAGKGATSAMAAHAQHQGKPFSKGSINEGEVAGYIGIKSESRGPFSFSLGDSGESRLLFQLLIDQIRVVKGSVV